MARCSTRSDIHPWISADCMYSHWPLELQQLLYYQSAFVNHPPFSSVQDLRILSIDCFKNLCVTKIILSSRGVLSKVSSRKKGGQNGHWPIYIRAGKALEFQVFVNKCIKKKKSRRELCMVSSSVDVLIFSELKMFLICLTPLWAHILKPQFSLLGIKWFSPNYAVTGETKCFY